MVNSHLRWGCGIQCCRVSGRGTVPGRTKVASLGFRESDPLAGGRLS